MFVAYRNIVIVIAIRGNEVGRDGDDMTRPPSQSISISIDWFGEPSVVLPRRSRRQRPYNCDRKRREQLGLQERRNWEGSVCISTGYRSVTSFGVSIVKCGMNVVLHRVPLALF
jgi:hypothetical protein